MKVLHVTSNLNPQRGGPVSALIGLADAQARVGLDVSVLVNHCEQSVEQTEFKSIGVRFVNLNPPLSTFRTPTSSLQSLEAAIQNADIVHIHGVWEEPQHLAALVARKNSKPYLIRPCGMLDPWCLSQKKWKKRLYYGWRQKADLNKASALHCTSDLEAQGTSLLKLRCPCIIEPNGVDVGKFEPLPSAATFRERYLKNTSRYLLFAGRLHPKKGFDLLIPAFADAKLKNVDLCIAGPDEDGYKSVIEQMADEHGIADKIIFTGMLQDEMLLSAFVGAELFVLSSYQENFGNAIVEALACGTPVLISDQVNIHPEITKAQVGGVVPLDIAILSQELVRWMSDDALREAAAKRAHSFVMQNYDWCQIAGRWQRHYEGMVADANRKQ